MRPAEVLCRTMHTRVGAGTRTIWSTVRQTDTLCLARFPCRLRRQRLNLQVRAQGDNSNGSGNHTEEADSRLEALERGSRRRKTSTKIQSRRQAVDNSPSSSSGYAEWKEGKLFPEGWDQMSLFQKAAELYSGKRGALFWANKAAFASLFVIGGAWVLFRIVGPLTGLYTLKNDLLSPPNL